MGRFNIVVIGGNNVDISATSLTSLVYGDSNPGKIYTGLGGVGRNIAENLVRLGQNVSLITVFGDDEFSRLVQNQARRINLNIDDSICVSNAASCVYVCINEPNGEMSVAVNDMELCAQITPRFLSTKLARINEADAVVIDANITEEAIDYIVQNCTAPIFADAVSAKKAARLHRSLPHIKALKANQIEMELLTGVTITHEYDMHTAALALHQMGVEFAFITLGSRGAFASDGGNQVFERPFPQPIRNTTGCGDAFMAASILAVLEQRSIEEILRLSLAAASICGQSEHAVSEKISYSTLTDYLATASQSTGGI